MYRHWSRRRIPKRKSRLMKYFSRRRPEIPSEEIGISPKFQIGAPYDSRIFVGTLANGKIIPLYSDIIDVLKSRYEDKRIKSPTHAYLFSRRRRKKVNRKKRYSRRSRS